MQVDKLIKDGEAFIKAEKEAEVAEYEAIYNELSFQELEAAGFAISNFEVTKAKTAFFQKKMVRFSKIGDQFFSKKLKIKTGDNVVVAEKSKTKSVSPVTQLFSGVVHKVTFKALHVIFDASARIDEETKFSPSTLILKSADNVTYDRIRMMFRDLEATKTSYTPNRGLLDAIFGGKTDIDNQLPEPVCKIPDSLSHFNSEQKVAIQKSVQANFYYLVHGPPGTGKTRTMAKIAEILASNPQHKILVTSPSNVGVDNLIQAIAATPGLRTGIVRLGHPSRADADSASYLFDNVLKGKLKADSVYKKMLVELESNRRKISKLESKKNYVDRQEIYAIKSEVARLSSDINSIEMAAIQAVFQDCQIVAATLSSIYDRKLQAALTPKGGQRTLFDYVLIDEAGQALNTLLYIGILHGKRVIFAGDHKQLPPTIKAKENMAKHVQLFETLINRTINLEKAADFSTILRQQYRMHAKIMSISSDYMYQGQLVADQSVSDKTLGIREVPEAPETSLMGGDCPVIFLNTFGSLFGESDAKTDQSSPLDKSKYNEGEGSLVAFMLLLLKRHYHISERDIGVITPYSAQVDYISRRVEELESKNLVERGITVATVDGFQGREKEVIVISTVRSNPVGDVGFLNDIRRMNVAITRAKKLLVVVGDESTIKKNDFMAYITNRLKQDGKVITPEDIDGEEVAGIVFKRSEFWKSGAFLINQEQKPKKKEPVEDQSDKLPKHPPRKSQAGKKAEAPETPSQPPSADSGEGLQRYWEEYCQELLTSDKDSFTVYRKLGDLESEVLSQVCERLGVRMQKSGKQVILFKPKAADPTPQNPQESEAEENQDDEAAKTTEKKKKKKKKAKKPVEEVKLTEEELLDQFLKAAELKKEICHFTDGPNQPICGKNIKVLNKECRYCLEFFCLLHGMPERHGCGDRAAAAAREEFRNRQQTPLFGHLDAAKEEQLREKLKRKIASEQQKRQPKQKKK